MTASTGVSLGAPYGPVPVNGSAGTLQVQNQSAQVPAQIVTVLLQPLEGPSETVTLVSQGDTLAIATDGLATVTISADSYPCTILLALTFGQSYALASAGPSVRSGVIASAMFYVKEATVTIGTAAYEFTPLYGGQQSVLFLADKANTGTIYASHASSVSAADFPLGPGDTLRLGVNVSVWFIASAAGQLLHTWAGA